MTLGCSICLKDILNDAGLKFGDDLICAECKQNYFQRLREGVTPAFRANSRQDKWMNFLRRTAMMCGYWFLFAFIPLLSQHSDFDDFFIMAVIAVIGIEIIRWRLKLKWRKALLPLALSNAMLLGVMIAVYSLLFAGIRKFVHLTPHQANNPILLATVHYVLTLPMIIFGGICWSLWPGLWLVFTDTARWTWKIITQSLRGTK